MLISEMDPPIINETSFSAANPSSYTLAEIWPFPINGTDPPSTGAGGGGLGLRMSGFGETTTNRNVSIEESTVTDQSGSRGAGKKRRDANSEDGSSKLVSANINNANDLNDLSVKPLKVLGSSEEHGGSKAEVEASSGSGNKSTEQVKDYIHVRARRDHATYSHSLAERARREKISETMKILQDLVPGCNKVIGRALVLDEIINYIRSLQCQVEFLSMKLEAVNSRMDLTIEGFPSKNFLSMKLEAVNSRMDPTIEGFPSKNARREKISVRMKILQDLVPGCNKVIGKALVLDEIINYIQSLQRQVEFLSMKLEAVNSRMDPTIEGFPSKNWVWRLLNKVSCFMEYCGCS